jgi:hypothetical protein
MSEDKDQRATDRVKIPGGSVVYRKRNKLGLFDRFSKPMELFNITKSGVCFKSDKMFDRGETLLIEIIIPGEQALRLLGVVRWIENPLNNHDTLIGAQFAAFGKGRNYNPIKSLERLRFIQEKFSEL